jgi:putative inorganic carbon (HCO3(-)) transporter
LNWSSPSLFAGSPGVKPDRRSDLLLLVAAIIGVAAAWLPLGSAALIVAGIALFIVVLVQPLAGIALALLAGPLGAVENVEFGTALPESGQVLFWIAVAAWLGQSVLRRRIVVPRTELNRPLALFIMVAALSVLGARAFELGFKELMKWLELAIVMLMVVDLASDRATQETELLGKPRLLCSKPVRGIVAMLLLAGLSQALIGIWQFGLSGDGPDHFLILERFYRAFGTFHQPNPFGGFMGIAAALGIGTSIGLLIAWHRDGGVTGRRPATEWIWFLFVTLSAVATVMALIMSWSRGAWLGFAAAMAVLTLFLPKRRWLGMLLVACGVVVLLFAAASGILPASVAGRLGTLSDDLRIGDVRGEELTEENYAVIERLAHWQAGVEMARDNLWTGVGFGNYEAAYEEYRLLNWSHPLGHAHNYYLNILAESGIFGAIAYLAFWAFVFLQLFRLLKRLDWPRRGIALGLLAAWTALAVHHLVDKLYVNNLYIFLGVMLGLQQILLDRDDKDHR